MNSKKTADYWQEIEREYYSLSNWEEEFSDFEDDYDEEEEVF